MKLSILFTLLCLGIPSWASKITLVGIEAEYHPIVLELLTNLSKDRAPEAFPVKADLCVADQLISDRLSKLECKFSAISAEAIAKTQHQCGYVQNPLNMYVHLPTRFVDFSDMLSVPTMLKVFGSPLTKTAMPGALQRNDFRITAESVTLKVFVDEFAGGLKERKTALENLNTECGNDSEMKMLLPKAFEELDRAMASLESTKNSWKTLNSLPYPTLTADERRMLSMFLSSMTWRARGGGIYKKMPTIFATQKNRVKYIWNSYTTILNLLGANKSMTKSMSFGLYSRGFKGWHDFWDMGTNDRYTLEEDFKLMTQRGEYQVESALESVKSHKFPTEALAFAGRQMGACYLYGWHGMKEPRSPWGPEFEIPYKSIGGGPTQWGELCFGAGLGLGLAETFLNSK